MAGSDAIRREMAKRSRIPQSVWNALANVIFALVVIGVVLKVALFLAVLVICLSAVLAIGSWLLKSAPKPEAESQERLREF